MAMIWTRLRMKEPVYFDVIIIFFIFVLSILYILFSLLDFFFYNAIDLSNFKPF